MIRPFSLVLYLLALIAFFFVGVTYAGMIDAGKNQGLAGGAIVLSYGVVSSIIGLMISLIFVYKSNRKNIIKVNIILTLSVISFYAYFRMKYISKQSIKDQESHKEQQNLERTIPILESSMAVQRNSNVPSNENIISAASNTSGLGMFSPDLSQNTFYFYNNPNLEKSLLDHTPSDSIKFKNTEYGVTEITSAPHYLLPAHLKLDYDILYFNVVSVGKEYLEVIVNSKTGQTRYVDKFKGNLKYWPEFLLEVSSVELLDTKTQKIRIKPLSNASTIADEFSFMQPLKIQNEWMYVQLINDDYTPVTKGWIKWRDKEKLLVEYSLLS